jgi:hypothetical protein
MASLAQRLAGAWQGKVRPACLSKRTCRQGFSPDEVYQGHAASERGKTFSKDGSKPFPAEGITNQHHHFPVEATQPSSERKTSSRNVEHSKNWM